MRRLAELVRGLQRSVYLECLVMFYPGLLIADLPLLGNLIGDNYRFPFTFIGKTNHAVNTYRNTKASFVSWTLDNSINVPEMIC